MDEPSKPLLLADETLDEIGPYTFIQKVGGHKLTSDTVCLADFALPVERSDRIMDLGTGTGALPLIFCFRSECRNIVGVELLEHEAEIAKRNVLNNRLSDRVQIIRADFRTLPCMFEKGSFDVVVSNPPYRKEGAGASPNRNRSVARFEGEATLKDLVEISRHLVSDDGRVQFVYPVERLFEVIKETARAGLVAARVRFIRSDRHKRAKIFLFEARVKAAGGLAIEEAGPS